MDYHELLADANSTEALEIAENNPSDASGYNYEFTIHELFEESVLKNPESTAVICHSVVLSYDQLNKRANKLANYLIHKGIQPNQIVGLMAERSFEMIIGIYGIIKAGGVYLPLSYADPNKRTQALLNDAVPTTILVPRNLLNEVKELDCSVCVIEDILEQDWPDYNPEVNCKASDPAYVIYTSGSTGMPKGVMVAHNSLVNRLKWMQKAYPISETDVILQKTPFTFDVSVWEIFWWSIQGAAVCMLPEKGEKNPQIIVNTIDEQNVTVVHFVPSMFNIFLQYLSITKSAERLKRLRLVFTSGEALKKEHLNLFNALFNDQFETSLINLYGPTEATIDVTHFQCPKGVFNNQIPIGKPIDNINIYIVKDEEILPDGETGELCIAGIGVAMGYLNRVDLTSEKFIANPANPNELLYKTGDLACYDAEGNIEYLGRIDQQVKIRGIRIELGEIESTIRKHSSIKSTVVLLQSPSENVSFLVVYYVADADIPPEELKAFTERYLPSYMIPNFFKRIPDVPVTSHGKVDRKALLNFSPVN